MKIILLERIAKLGRTGDVVSVRDGYARNFLLPRRRAMRATAGNIASFEARREEIEAQNLKEQSAAEEVAATIEGKAVTSIQQAGESGQLYGSVNAREIAKLLASEGIAVNHSQIILDVPIKMLGVHSARIALHGDVFATVLVNAARSIEDAVRQMEAWRRGEVVATTQEPAEEEATPSETEEPEELEEVEKDSSIFENQEATTPQTV
ncbi:MAG: 50S ribosomal protein L9 [Hyphomicrobiales bacterium]|nr:50S ribosomal protein L9 [Hyphomicrobiales bacterium]MCY4038664.1 50S ribosomal protein L9 [Hyphomicrobiales bacterium]